MCDWCRPSTGQRIGSKLRLAICIGVASTASAVSAVQLAYEPFNIGDGPGEYSIGPLHGQPDPPLGPPGLGSFFAGNWVDPVDPVGHVVQATSIMPGTPGGSVTSVGDGRAARYLTAPWDANTNGTFYLSFFANFGASDHPLHGIGYRSVEFWPDGSAIGQTANRMQIGYDQFATCPGPICTPENDWRTRMQFRVNGPTNFAQLLTDYTFSEDGVTHGVLIKFELSDMVAADSVAVYLDPPVMIGASNFSELPPPTAIADGLDFTLGAVGAVSTFGGSGTRPVFDELRVGTTLADVLPPTDPERPCAQVDYGCYLEILSHMHLSGAAAGDGDINGDGIVTIADYRLWKDNRTDIGPGSGSLNGVGVPEPASWSLVAAIAFALVTYRRGIRTSVDSVGVV